MFAVFKTGGQQYRVKVGDKISVEKTGASVGEELSFDNVLMLKEQEDKESVLGTPTVAGAVVKAKLVETYRAPKVRIVKWRRRKHSRTITGHRQWYDKLTITEIKA